MHGPDFFHRGNADYVEQLYAQYQRDPRLVSGEWAAFFAGFEAGLSEGATTAAASGEPATARGGAAPADVQLAEGVYDLVHSYRELGHCLATLDPLGQQRPEQPLLELAEFGLNEADLDRHVEASGFLGPTDRTVRGLLNQLRATYCGTLGVEYMDITDKRQRTWLQERMEPIANRPAVSAEDRRRVLSLLVAAQTFEEFLHAKFVGQKRFSIEGAESLIPLLDTLIEDGAALGADEVVLGMAHRGRLNVLAHVIHKPYELILSEFAGTSLPQETEGDGDVKYHLGYSHDRTTARGDKVHCSLSSNPSHLELVNPVIEGIVRAKQQRLGDTDRSRVVPILIHGEAAFTGQGIVPETLGLSELPAYRTGGTIHVIVNNQVGFTATPEQTRFTPYPTDVAKMIQAPIFHVNGDDPDAVVHAARLAIAFRQEFKVDVMIDLWCYRKHGHNEGDDPTFTQPRMYQKIAQHTPVAESYAAKGAEGIGGEERAKLMEEMRGRLEAALEVGKQERPRQRIQSLGGLWQGLRRAGHDWNAATAVAPDVLARVAEGAARLPEDFHLHRKLQRLIEGRTEMARGERPVDWGGAEMLALGSLLLEGTPVRLAGQDSERGTFSHRHAVLHDTQTGKRYVPLANLAEGQAPLVIVNTLLSELAVLGFEYGYSSADPHTLVIWEAQFGDFVNGAQPVIDQFLSSAESKWQRMSGLVLLLPHGYEGQGPEHSSARLERFLQLCAENNLQVINPTHPAQYFHALRRQMRRNFRKPLVCLTPKSLLREERSASPLAEFTSGGFHVVLDDPAVERPESVRRVLLCSGRVFYPLAAARDERNQREVAIVRVEQLYPFPRPEIEAALARYRNAAEVCWVQEEPRNMGAWSFIEPRLRELLPAGSKLSYVGRDEAASPAVGSFRLHQVEEDTFVRQSLDVAPAAIRAKPPAVKSAAAS